MLKEKELSFQSNMETGQNHLGDLFEELGLDIEKLNPNILRKLLLLNKKTETFKDEERSIYVARALFKYYEDKLSDTKFTEAEQRAVLIGTMFTDIGKTGPKNATPEQEELILDIYGMENIVDPKKITVEQFIKDNFPQDAADSLRTLKETGVGGDITMREFYNLHPKWTLEIVNGDGVLPEAVASAATHHMLEGVNPEEIVGKNSRSTRYFGDNVFFDRAEKLITLLDKYDAFRQRGKKEHKEAIELVRRVVRTNLNFAEDREFEELLDNLDAMISADERVYEE